VSAIYCARLLAPPTPDMVANVVDFDATCEDPVVHFAGRSWLPGDPKMREGGSLLYARAAVSHRCLPWLTLFFAQDPIWSAG